MKNVAASWKCSCVLEHVLSMHKGPGSISSKTKPNQMKPNNYLLSQWVEDSTLQLELNRFLTICNTHIDFR